jgi:hypothetical protein
MEKYLEPFLLLSSVSAELSFIITQNNLTPSPPHFGKVSKWNIINEAGLAF